jgi:hypothetical protein
MGIEMTSDILIVGHTLSWWLAQRECHPNDTFIAQALDLIEKLAAENAKLTSRYVSMVSHLEGPYGFEVREPGSYEMLLKIFPNGSGFVRTIEKHTYTGQIEDKPYPPKEWKDFHDVFKDRDSWRQRAEKAEAENIELQIRVNDLKILESQHREERDKWHESAEQFADNHAALITRIKKALKGGSET